MDATLFIEDEDTYLEARYPRLAADALATIRPWNRES